MWLTHILFGKFLLANSEISLKPLSPLPVIQILRHMGKKSQQERLEAKERRKEERKIVHVQKKREEDSVTDTSFLVPHTHVAEYEFSSDGLLRKVPPYYFTYSTFAKRRWLGKTISQVFLTEFQFRNDDEVKERIAKGYVTVNENVITSADYLVKDLDKIEHRVHRHELPVLNEAIQVVHQDEQMVVVNKPPSIPIHPCGRYMLNSLIYILAKEHNLTGLRIVHRLDRMTSGLVIFGRKYDVIQKLYQAITGRRVKKFYLARVRGQFPFTNEEVASSSLLDPEGHIAVKCEASSSSADCDPRLVVQCRAPLGTLHPKFGIQAVLPLSAGGKCSFTQFLRLHYCPESATSLVLCRLHTGRTHQIRVHLQYMGFPIVNDPLYTTAAWGPSGGRHAHYGKSQEQLVEDLAEEHNAEHWGERHGVVNEPSVKRQKTAGDMSTTVLDADCPECMEDRIQEPPVESLVLYLHALRYALEEWDFVAPMPSWASTQAMPTERDFGSFQEEETAVVEEVNTKECADSKVDQDIG